MPVEEPALPDLVEKLRLEQQERWQKGDRVVVESYFPLHPRLHADETGVLHLVYNEVLLREAAGERPQLAEYVRRFPQLAGKLTPLFEVHRAIESDQLLGVVADQSSPTGTSQEKHAAPIAATIDDPVRERPGTVIGPYKLLQQIGEGGMGTVYMAEQTKPVQRKVALKLVKPGMDSQQVTARFEAERQALALMDHPNIAKVLDGGTTESGRPYFVMELVKGVPITKYCDEHRLTPRERLELFVPVCQAVQHAHQKGIIHRDLKPSNVMVCIYDGKPVPKVIDFGVAKATGPKLTERTLYTEFGAIVGTFEYMSPEQAQLDQLDVDTRSDIYSLGVLLYELLTGTTPLERKRLKEVAVLELLRLVREEEAPRPSTRLSTTEALPSIAANRGTEPKKLTGLMRAELDWIVLKALEKDRNRRYETANGFAMDIQRYLADEAVAACPPSAAYRFRKLARRNKVAFWATGVVALALIVGTAVSVWQAVRATRAEKLADARREAESRARQEAENNFRMAREAVDNYYTRISESTLLDKPGLQALRKDLLQEALKFYERFSNQRSADPILQAEVGAMYFRLALIYLDMDLADEFIKMLNRGVEIVGRLVREHPNNPELHQRLAGIYKGERRVHGDTKLPSDPVATLRVLQRSAEIWKQLVRANPKIPAFQSGLARIYLGIGAVLIAIGRQTEARQAFEDAREIYEKLVSDNPLVAENRADLIETITSMSFYGFHNDEELCRRAIDLGEELVAQFPAVPHYRFSLARAHRFLGNVQSAAGKPAEALKAHLLELDILQKLVAEHAVDPGYRRELAWAYMDVGRLFRTLGKPKEAEQAFRRALEMRERLFAEFPNAMYYFDDVAESAGALADLLRSTGRPKEAEKLYDNALAERTKAIEHQPDRWESWYWRGRCYFSRQLWDKALADFSKAIELNPQRDNPGLLSDTWHYRAKTYVELSQFDKGVADFTAAIQLVPGNFWHWLLRGQAQAALGQWDKALADYTKAIELSRDACAHILAEWPNRQERLIGVLRRTGQSQEVENVYRRTVALCEKLAAAFPNVTDYRKELARNHNRLGLHLRQAGRSQEAQSQLSKAQGYWRADSKPELERLKKAADGDPKNGVRWGDLAIASYRFGKWDESLGIFKTKEHLGWGIAGSAYQWFYIAMAHSQLDHQEEARQWYYRSLDWIATSRDGHLGDLQAEASAVLGLSDPGDRSQQAWDLSEEGAACEKQGQPEKAKESYGKAIDVYGKLAADFPAVPAYRAKLVELLIKTGRQQEGEKVYRLSIDAFEKLARDFPGQSSYRDSLARTHLDLGRWLGSTRQFAQAEKEFRRAISIWDKIGADLPNEPIYRRHVASIHGYDLAPLLTTSQQPRQAEEALRRSVARWERLAAKFPKSVDYQNHLTQCQFNLAVLLAANGRPEEADKAYRKLLEMAPQNAVSHNNLAWLLATCPEPKFRDTGRAIAEAKKAVELASKEGNHWNTLGAAHYYAGDWKAAIAALEKSMELRRGGDSFDWFFLAMARWQLGDKKEARKWYDQAVQWMDKNQPKNEELRRFRAETETLLKVENKPMAK
jgi:tetratricopeptide (TPR) repeat protein/serine/threonine protein kinase